MRNKFIVSVFSIALLSFVRIAAAEEIQIPETKSHIVVKGDTLWDISGKFLSDPFKWPELWKFNAEIKNPHLIYPGDVVRLTPNGLEIIPARTIVLKEAAEEASAPEEVVEEAPAPEKSAEEPALAEEAPLLTPEEVPAATKLVSSFLKRNGFMTKVALDASGVLVKSKDSRLYLEKGTVVYMSFKEPSTVNIGDRYSVFKVGKRIFHPKTKKYFGNVIEISGAVEVTDVNGKTVEGKVVETDMEFQIGDRLIPYEMPLKEIEFTPAENEVSAVIVATHEDITEIAKNDVIFLDKGGNDGLKPGNVLHVYRENAKVRNPLNKSEKLDIPSDRIGSIVVVRTAEKSSTAIVLKVSESLLIGDAARTAAAK